MWSIVDSTGIEPRKNGPREIPSKIERRKRDVGNIMLDLQTKDQEKYFLHEHPKSAKSWKKETSERPNVEIVEGPMCRWKMVGRDASGEGRIRKPTYWMTNSPELAETLRGVCTNDLPGAKRERHRHIHLVNGRAKMARIYPPALVRAVLRALKRQMKADGEY